MAKTNKALKLAMITALLILALAWTNFAQIAGANPYHHIWIYQGDAPSDQVTKPPEISIQSPGNGELLASSNISVSLWVKVGASATAKTPALEEIYYKADWLPNKTSIYAFNPKSGGLYQTEPITEFSETINVIDVPDGNRTIRFYAVEKGRYQTGQGPPGSGLNVISYAYYYVSFNITGVCSLYFTLDTVPPNVSILSLGKAMWGNTEIPLNFTVSEKASVMAYSLDGQDKVTVRGNTTLTGLPYGKHNITVYATDAAGNIGASENLYFTIGEPESFPTMPVVVASASVAVIGTSLLVFYKKRSAGAGYA